MPTTNIDDLRITPERTVTDCITRCINYGKNKLKTLDGELVKAVNCNIETAAAEMLFTQKEYESRTGKKMNAIVRIDPKTGKPESAPIIWVIRQSFKPGEVDMHTAHEIGSKLAAEYLGDEFQYTVNTHIDKDHLHTHIYFNAVALDACHKYNDSYGAMKIRKISDKLAEEYGLSIVIPGQERRSKLYSKCAAVSYRDCLKKDIDAIKVLAKNYDEFLSLMRKDYIVATDGKYLRFKHRSNGQQKFIRSYSLGQEYTEESLRRSFLVNRVPQEKIKLSFTQKLNAKTKVFNNTEKSYSQRLRNVKALFFTVGVLNENSISKYTEILDSIQATDKMVSQAKEKVIECEASMKNVEQLLATVDVVKEMQPIVDGYEHALLKERYLWEHGTEIDLYNMALSKLSQNGLTADDNTTQKLLDLKLQSSSVVMQAKHQLDALQKKLDNIHTAKDIVDRLFSARTSLASEKEVQERLQR